MKIYVCDRLLDVSASELQRDLALLPQWRREVALTYKIHDARVQSVKAFRLLTVALQEGWGIGPDVEFVTGPHGKPSLPQYPHIHFNLSHCREAALCVTGDHEVGCDIESVRPTVSDDLIHKCMNDSEAQQIFSSSQPAVEFTRFWTMKEAVVKLSGEGLTVPLHQILDNTSHLNIHTHVDIAKGIVYSVAWQGPCHIEKNVVSLY